MNGESHLVIRADGGPKIGFGHLMRCLALAQAWQDKGGSVSFVVTCKIPKFETRLRLEQINLFHLNVNPGSCEDARQTIEWTHGTGASWVVVDGYQFDTSYQEAIKEAGLQLLFIDDYGHAKRYVADIILNQNTCAQERLYTNRAPNTKLLLGGRYILLRREFLKWRDWNRDLAQKPKKILVSFGGADPDNATFKIIQALMATKRKDLEVAVILGAAYSHSDALQTLAVQAPFIIKLRNNVADMPELMAWADLAVSASGSTAWELAFMGLPSILVPIADNQRPIATWLADQGIAQYLEIDKQFSEQLNRIYSQLLNMGLRQQMSQRGRRLVDGDGCSRVIEYLREPSLKLRQVSEGDCELIWRWANDPDVRRASFESEPIPWNQHTKWFDQKINDPEYVIYIATTNQDLPIGQVRFEIANHEAVISVMVDRWFRNQGYGLKLLKIGCDTLLSSRKVKSIHAYIKQNNKASERAFGKAGFQHQETIRIKDCPAFHMVLYRECD